MHQHIISYYTLVLQKSKDQFTREIAFTAIMEYQQLRMSSLINNYRSQYNG